MRAEQWYNGLQIRQNDIILLKSKTPPITATIKLTRLRICCHLDCREKCQQFDIATAICKASTDMPHLDDAGDDDSLSEDPGHESEGHISHPVTTTVGLLKSLWTVASVSGTIWKCSNYFELRNALQYGLYPCVPLPYRTIVHGKMALHLARDPTMKMMAIGNIIDKFSLPDLHGALADFLDWVNNGQPLKIGGRRAADTNSLLPFDHLQVWTKMQLQNRSYHALHHIFPPQTINALPPSEAWTSGPHDVVLVNIDGSKVWPHSSLEGVSSRMHFSYWFPNSVSGHHITQLRLIFHVVPPRRAPHSPGTDLFLIYTHHFNIVPQLPPIGRGQSNEKGPYPEPSTGMHLLKHAHRADGSIMGDIVPLAQLRTLVDLVPCFGKQANRQLMKETVLEYSSEFWLNKYFSKKLFYALKCI